jgi:myo-inositol-1-phosphate synthase
MSNFGYGLWLIGARGGVAGCTILGLAALKRGLIPKWGLTTELPQFAKLPFPAWHDWVVGGHEIRETSLDRELREFSRQNKAFDSLLVDQCSEDLEAVDKNIRWGTLWGADEAIRSLASPKVPTDSSAAAAVARLEQDIAEFRRKFGLKYVIVVHVASTEPPVDTKEVPGDWTRFAGWLESSYSEILPPSTLYAVAALRAGCSYINFTPSLGPNLPPVFELAFAQGCCLMGCDGKTGETLLKSVLAPLFACRNLRVLSWVGHNIFGNLDGKILDHPQHKASKIASKDSLVHAILGYRPQTHVSIEYIESLGDWKTAWDHVHFEGFFGTKMVLQFIWQGCDSVLAAPLVLDLARWSVLASERGHVGPMPFLACYFKSPYGVDQHDFAAQVRMLEAWALGK